MLFSWIASLFKKNIPVDLGELKVDCHSHLIPGIDDGAKDISDSLNLIKSLKELGYQKIITTPHIMSDMYRNDKDTIINGLDDVKKALDKEGIDIEFEAAAEYYLDEVFEKKIESEPLLTFGNKFVLFELSYLNKPVNLEQAIFALVSNGYQPVLAHPERYPYLFDDALTQYQKIRDMGVKYQVNILSILGKYGPQALRAARKLIDNDMVDLLGSDLHNMGQVEFMRTNLNDKYLNKLLEKQILQNQTLL